MVSSRAYRRDVAISGTTWTGVRPEPAPDSRTDEQIRAGLRDEWAAAQAASRAAVHGVPPGFLAIVLWDAGADVQDEAVAVARRLPAEAPDVYWREPSGEGSIDVAFLQVAAWADHGRASKRLAASHLQHGASRSRLHRVFAPRLSRRALLTIADTAELRGQHGDVLADVCRRVTCTGLYAPPDQDSPSS